MRNLIWTLGALVALALPAEDEALALLEELKRAERIPGLSFAVIVEDELVAGAGVGSAQLEPKIAVSSDTRFRLGSVSKLITATLTALLAERGEVDLDASVRDAIDWLPDAYTDVTLRQLLGHQAGVRHYAGKDFDPSQPGGTIDARDYASTDEALALFIEDPLVARPGELYSYTTFGYTLISAVLEAVTETPFLELVEREISEPLSLATLGPDRFGAQDPTRTGFYALSGDEVQDAAAVNPAYKWAGGGLLATATDLAQFGAAHFEPGLLKAGTLEEMFTPQTTSGGDATIVGLGWRVGSDAAGRSIVHHAGSMGGCRAVLVVWRAERVAVSVLSNLSGTPGDILSVAEQLASPYLER